MSSNRLTIPIRRSGRKAGEAQQRRSQPGRYRPAWSQDLTNPPAGVRVPSFSSMDVVPTDLRERAVRKSFFVARFVQEGCPRGKLLPYARAAAEASGVEVPPATTLRDWARQYQHYGLLGLVDKVRSDSGRSRTVPQQVREVALVCVVGARHGTAQALALLGRLLPGVPLPTYDALRREIHRFKRRNPHLMSLASEGLTGWRNRFRLALPGIEFPAGFRYAVDSTVSDVWVRVRNWDAPGGWEAVRCVLTVVEDVGSREILTFNLALARIDSGIVLGTFRRAVIPGLNHPGLPQMGFPSEVQVDSGPEHLGAFARALTEQGVKVIHTSREPEQNARIERVIQTIITEVLANLPGYDPVERPLDPYASPQQEDRKNLSALKYEKRRREIPVDLLLPIEELEARIHAWITVYNSAGHQQLAANRHLLREAMQVDQLLESQTFNHEIVA